MPSPFLDIVRRDVKMYVNKTGYQEEIEMTTPDGSMTINITGWAVKHHISFDSDGNQVNTKNARATIDEQVLVAKGYPTRNVQQEIALIKHRVSYKDSSGIVKHYYVRESFPDETLGMICLILGDYKV
jgi:hypothetical protein